MLFLAAALLALLLCVGFGVLAVLHFRQPGRLWSTPLRAAATLALAVWVPAALFWAWQVFTSGSSTAVLSLVYVPLLATLASAAVFLPVWAVGEVAWRLRGGGKGSPALLLAALAVLVLVVLAAFLAVHRGARWLRVAGEPLPPAQMERLARQADDRATLKLLAGRPDLTPNALLTLARRDGEALRDPTITVPELLGIGARGSLATGGDPVSVLQRVATHPNTPVEALRLLAGDRSAPVAAAVARNPATPRALLAELADRPEMVVDLAVAGHPATPPAVLESLHDHPSAAVRREVAERAAAGGAVLAELAGDPEWSVRGAVARNRATPPAVLADLADDPDDRVRFYLATNPNTPAPILQSLTDDPDEKVRRHAAQRLADSPDA